MKLIRLILGNIILALDWLTSPKGMVRLPEAQKKVDSELSSLQIYELKMCPFCVKVRRAMKRLSLTIQTRDVGVDPKAQEELMQGGKKDQVPCLRITNASGAVEWMYESSEIIAYLEKRF